MRPIIPLLMLWLYTYSTEQTDLPSTLVSPTEPVEEECHCVTNETISSTKSHLSTLMRITSVKLVSSLRTVAHTANEEVKWIISQARFRIVSDVQRDFPQLYINTNFSNAMEELFFQINKLVFEKKRDSQRQLDYQIRGLLKTFFESIFPPSFLCVSMGVCKTTTLDYQKCLAAAAPTVAPELFGENRVVKISRRLANAVHKYKTIFRILEELTDSAVSPEKNLDDRCVRRMADVTRCDECATSGVGYCKPSCEDAVNSCLATLPTSWDQKILVLKSTTGGFDDGMISLERGIVTALTRASEESSPAAAKSILAACGKLQESKSQRSASENRIIIPPSRVNRRTVALVKQFSSYSGWWQRLSSKMCAAPSTEALCWNGYKHVQSEYDYEEALASVKKDVGPPADRVMKPSNMIDKDSHVEGSGFPGWTDDEDFVGGSGSGEPPVIAVRPDSDFVPEMASTSTHTTTTEGYMTPKYFDVDDDFLPLDDDTSAIQAPAVNVDVTTTASDTKSKAASPNLNFIALQFVLFFISFLVF